VLLKNLVEKRFRFSLAKRKEYLNSIETEFNNVLGLLGSYIGTTISNLASLINSAGSGGVPSINQPISISNVHISWLELSSDFTTNPKVFIGQQSGGDWVVASNNQTMTSAETIFESFHRCSVATTDPATKKHGQYVVYKGKTIPLCCADFITLSNNNVLKTADGRYGKFYRILWNPHTETAEIDYGVNQKFTNNLKEQLTIDGSTV
jgi:hypothetical protein